jgi:serine/threonine protein kinase
MPNLKWVNSRYEILKQIGHGGSGQVYQAIDRKDLNEGTVAIKVLSESIQFSSSLLQEFFHREVRSLSTLNHPHIIHLLDSGYDEQNKVLYIVLEYLERADTLRDRIKTWSPDILDILDLLVEVMDGISSAHLAYIIHRDLNPSNILLDRNGNIKIIDFGVSKILSTIHSNETVGDFFTRAYASPEQIAYKEISYSTDLYSLAAVAFYMLTKTDPNNSIQLTDQINGISKITPEIKAVLVRMADEDPLKRYETSSQALSALRGAKAQNEVQSQKIFVQLSQRAIKNLYDQTIIKSQAPEEAKAIIKAGLDADEVFVSKVVENKYETYKIIGDGIWLECSLVDSSDGEPFSFIVRSVQTHISPHQLEKARQDGYPIHANWKVGLTQDPIPSNVCCLSYLVDQIDNFVHTKLIEKRVQERRADLVEGWRNILDLDRELKGESTFRVEYLSWRLEEQNHVIALQLKGEVNLEDFIGIGQMVMMSTNQQRSAPAGHFLRQEANIAYLSKLSYCDTSLLAKIGALTADERQWAATWSRQQKALETVTNDRCANPRLANILIDPSQAGYQVVDEVEEYRNEGLDLDKKQIVNQALNAKDIYLVQGPPGTGKTVVITEIIAQVLARNPKTKILLVSQSNVAVDHVLEKVVKLLPSTSIVRIGKEEYLSQEASGYFIKNKLRDWLLKAKEESKKFALTQVQTSSERSILESYRELVESLIFLLRKSTNSDLTPIDHSEKDSALALLSEAYPGNNIVFTASSLSELLSNIDKQIEKYKKPIERTIEEWNKRLDVPEELEDAYLEVCSIIAGTCVGIAGKRNLPDRFDLTIVDEAGRATPSELLIPLVRSEKCILVGDHKQLPPVFDFEVMARAKTRKDIDPIWLEQSLFEYLFNNLDPRLKTTLKIQYRMHPHIANLISNVFYKDEGLQTGISPQERNHGWSKWPDHIVWLSTSLLEDRWEESSQESKYNLREVRLITHELKNYENILQNRKATKNIAIISGYSAQIEQLINQIEPKNEKRWKSLHIEINTVDAFQGREEDIVFYSVVRSNRSREIGFLSDYRRLNVALSRARQLLFIVGDHRMVGQASTRGINPFKEVIAHILEHSDECTLKEHDNE